jgi:hypothetical protein
LGALASSAVGIVRIARLTRMPSRRSIFRLKIATQSAAIASDGGRSDGESSDGDGAAEHAADFDAVGHMIGSCIGAPARDRSAAAMTAALAKRCRDGNAD